MVFERNKYNAINKWQCYAISALKTNFASYIPRMYRMSKYAFLISFAQLLQVSTYYFFTIIFLS